MYTVSKRIEVAGAHRLDLPYESKCRNLHGHNWVITVFCRSESLKYGMVVDFSHIKKFVMDTFDHQCLNNILEDNPTAENIAKYIHDHVEKCYKVTVQESEGNVATYED